MIETRHKSIDEQLESAESLGIDEQLEINISGRKFSISLKGFEPNAIVEIKELLETQSVDLLDLMRAYLNSVHSRCELESQVAHITQKITQKLPQVFITQDFDEALESSDEQSNDDIDSELDEEDLAESSEFEEDLAGDFGDDFGGFGEEFGHSGEVYGAFGEFNMLGGFGIHSKSEIEPSEEELDEIMAQKEQEAQNQKTQNQVMQNEVAENIKATKTVEATGATKKDAQSDKKSRQESNQENDKNPQNQLDNQTIQNQTLENHSQKQVLDNEPPKVQFDQARFDFSDFSNPLHNKNEAQINLEMESKISDSSDFDDSSDSKVRSKNDLEVDLDFHAKSKADLKGNSSVDSKKSEASHAGLANVATNNTSASSAFDFMTDTPILEPKPKSPLARITKFFKNP